MSLIGGPIAAGVAGAPEASRSASKAKEKPRNDEARQRRRFEDALELHVSGVESTDAVHNIKEHASEDADSERQAKQQPHFQQRPFNAAARGLSQGYTLPPQPPSTIDVQESDPKSSSTTPPASTPNSPAAPSNDSLDVTG